MNAPVLPPSLPKAPALPPALPKEPARGLGPIKIQIAPDVHSKAKTVEVADFATLESEIREALRSRRAVVSRAQPTADDPTGEQAAKKLLPTFCWADGRQSAATEIRVLQLDNDQGHEPIPGVRGFRFESPRSKPHARRWKEIYVLSRLVSHSEYERISRHLASVHGADRGATPAGHPCFVGRFEGDPDRAFETLSGPALDVDAVLASLPPELPRSIESGTASDLWEPVQRSAEQIDRAYVAFEPIFTPGGREPLTLRAGVYLRRQGWTREDAEALWTRLVQAHGDNPSSDYVTKLIREWSRSDAGAEGLAGAEWFRSEYGEAVLSALDAACRDDRYGDPIVVEAREREARAKAAEAQVTGPKEPKPAWIAELILGPKGVVVPCAANVLTILTMHPAWSGVLAFDEFAQDPVKLLFPPVRTQDGKPELGDWADEDTVRLCAWLASECGMIIAPGTTEPVISTAALPVSFHPVRTYLRSCEWDGVPRVDRLLIDYFGAEDTAYTRAVGAIFMLSCIARAMVPGCKVDTMLILEGKQGIGKSRGLKALVPVESWFSDSPLDLESKDRFQVLRRKWIYEVPELDSIRGRDEKRVKAFLSSASDNYRASYGRRSRDYPRQVVFAGSTNEDHYLSDPTGARRFLPVQCGRIDVDAIVRDRDQLWAEAFARYEQGEQWWPSAELEQMCVEQQAAREEVDPMVELVERWLTGRHSAEGVTTAEVAEGLGIGAKDQTRAVATRVGTALRKLGWGTRGDSRPRRYLPPPEWAAVPVSSRSVSPPGAAVPIFDLLNQPVRGSR